jgi:flagellar hook-basal body complex protein FliE
MTTTPLNAAGVYGAISRLANRGVEGQTADVAGSGATDFAALVRDQIGAVVEQGNRAEAKQADLMAGKADLVDVVTAVSETELALGTMVSIRDRVISAYEDIMRMPI